MPVPDTKIFLGSTVLAGGGHTLTPNAAGDFAPTVTGISAPVWLTAVGDLNGDGVADVAVGASGDDDKAVNAGRVFVTLNSFAAGSSSGLADAASGSFIIDGVSAGDQAGFSLAGSADINGDGRGELLIGAPGMDNTAAKVDAGAAFVIWGPSASGGLDLGDPFAGGGKGYAIKGEAAGDAAGYTVLSVGDMNGDGRADMLVGAPGQDAGGTDAGAAYVVWGKTSASAVQLTNVAAGTGGFKINGLSAGDAVGTSLGTLGDQNGDGKSEILIGVRDDNSAGSNAGAVYVVDGKATGAAVDLAQIALGNGGYKISGVAQDDAGAFVANAGDLNGDGLDDILIGAPRSDSAYVVYGKADHLAVDLADVAAGVGGFQIVAEATGDLDTLVLAGNVDLNRDGIDDLVIGASGNEEGGANAGAVYVVWGGGGNGTVDLSLVAQGIGGAKIVGAAGSQTGASVAIGGDMNGDGVADLIIGAPGSGESVKVLYTPTVWQPDTNIYGTSGDDVMGAGYGGVHQIGIGADAILGLFGNDSIAGGDGNDSIEGGDGNDTLSGEIGNDLLDGGADIDSMAGGAGDDTYLIDQAGDLVSEAAGEGDDLVLASVAYTLSAEVERLTLVGAAHAGTGNALNNVITGNSGDDTLDGAAGNDTLIGGNGNDTYRVDSSKDVIIEDAAGGTDTVVASLNYKLGTNQENLTLTGAARVAVGNGAANTLTGTAANETLNGGAGADHMIGGGGNDSYYIDNLGDVVTEAAGGGTDTVFASVNITLSAEVENLTLLAGATQGTGNALANILRGTIGDDTLDGGLGADSLYGGTGNDTYLIDTAADKVIEAASAGIDTVKSSVDFTTLGDNVENLILLGAAHHGSGNSLNNTLTGTAQDDTLNGAAGDDTMIGGGGNDTYLVNSVGDVITEAAGGGTDTVRTAISYTLAANVENMEESGAGATGTGNTLDNLLKGSSGTQTLIGLEGNDTLDAGAGADVMIGGAGDDTYYVDNAGDVVVEDVGGGSDTVVLLRNGLSVAANVENIRLGGTAHVAVGGDGANTLAGAAGDDDLDGGAGDDLLLGGDGDDDLRAHSGHDTLSGGAGDDTYHVSGSAVEIEDYLGHDALDTSDSTGNDHIDLSGETNTEVEGQIIHITPGGTTSGPLDVQFLQDRTGSFGDDIATVRALIPQIVGAVQAVQINSTFGVSSFVDKPVSPFGATGEWVYKQELGLTADAAALSATYAAMAVLNGMDGPEAQIEALMQLALHSADVGFRPDSARFVVLFTDAPFHLAGDGALGGILTANNGDALFPGNGAMEDYPTIAQVQAALAAANIIPIFAVAGGYEASYQDLATQLGRGAVVTLTADSSNIVTAITDGITQATTTHIEDAHAGAGNDTVIGGVEDNGLWGNAGSDVIDGRGGADHIDGGAGDDALSGGDGNDSFTYSGKTNGFDAVDGGTGDDSMIALSNGTVIGVSSLSGIETISADGHSGVVVMGSSAANLIDLSATTLIGISAIDGGAGKGRDTIIGSAGADTIIGGGGADLLTGGSGADVFVFRTTSDSRTTAKDHITDFTQGEDVVNLMAIDADTGLAGDQAFSFVGSAAFSHVAGELRADTGTAGIVRLMGDVNGDGLADFEMQFDITAGMPAPMTVADFML